MAKEKGKEGSEKKAKVEKKTSVRSYKQGIEVEKQKMGEYSKKFGASVKSLQGDFKKHAKDLKDKVDKLKGDIKDQVKENKEAASHMNSNVKLLLGEINKTKKNFQAYAQAFWG